jgi:hypothetical protein
MLDIKNYFKDKKSIIIKTYAFESGLWYLAESLILALESQGHNVYVFPKAKFSKSIDSIYLRTYPEPKDKEYFSKYKILPVSNDKLINEQIGNYIVKYNVDYIISFESLMQKSGWMMNIKSRFKSLKIIDVPMPEWIDKAYVDNKSYNLFDDIWCLNDMTYNIFNSYNNKTKVKWNLVNKELFNKKQRKNNKKEYHVLHLASLNKDFSSKNTAKVIKVFTKFLEENSENDILIKLNVLNAHPKDYLKSNNFKNIVYNRHNKKIFGEINFIEGPKTRTELSEFYKDSDLLLVPSEKEGLSLPLYEAHACGCAILSSNAEPMNISLSKYLVKVANFSADHSFVKKANIDELDFYLQLKKAYEDFKNEK